MLPHPSVGVTHRGVAMSPRLQDRIVYGRAVRVRALCLIEAHGHDAEAIARDATTDAGLPFAERSFLEAVAARIARFNGETGFAAR